MEQEEKRKGTKPVPDDPLKYMNEEQVITYHRMQSFGWCIKLIRRPLFQRPVCILTDPEQTVLALIEDDGILNKYPDIQWRGVYMT